MTWCSVVFWNRHHHHLLSSLSAPVRRRRVVWVAGTRWSWRRSGRDGRRRSRRCVWRPTRCRSGHHLHQNHIQLVSDPLCGLFLIISPSLSMVAASRVCCCGRPCVCAGEPVAAPVGRRGAVGLFLGAPAVGRRPPGRRPSAGPSDHHARGTAGHLPGWLGDRRGEGIVSWSSAESPYPGGRVPRSPRHC
jgi:hypothetical protein